jgi:hypothetical protein
VRGYFPMSSGHSTGQLSNALSPSVTPFEIADGGGDMTLQIEEAFLSDGKTQRGKEMISLCAKRSMSGRYSTPVAAVG